MFPGDSDVDQLHRIIKCFGGNFKIGISFPFYRLYVNVIFSLIGRLCQRHQTLLCELSKSSNVKIFDERCEIISMNGIHALHNIFPSWSTLSLNVVALCLK